MKKLIYICLLLILFIGVYIFFNYLKNNSAKENENSSLSANKEENTLNSNNSNKEIKTIIKKLDDGIVYSITNDEVKPDIVIGDEFYDTQITDIYYNYSSYKDKIVEIEGMYMESESYTFVGRYSTSNLCQFCPQGFSYLEYIWEGEKLNFTEKKEWLKIKGTIEKGNDETSYYQDFYYIKPLSIEVMNQRGKDTVSN